MIYIINYGLGNIRAFMNVFEQLRISAAIAEKRGDLKKATKLILPGVGAFDQAMKLLNKSGLREDIEEKVQNEKIPILGICVGMQILALRSEEGNLPGLGWINGEVKKFDEYKIISKPHLPHMGWNTVNFSDNLDIFSGLDQNCRFYFLHSYYFQCNNNENSIATTEYGINYSSVIKEDNIYGVQFHPEKSHLNGIRILKNFAEL